MKNKDIAISILGTGMGCIAAYLEVNGSGAGLLWLGVFFCFITVIG